MPIDQKVADIPPIVTTGNLYDRLVIKPGGLDIKSWVPGTPEIKIAPDEMEEIYRMVELVESDILGHPMPEIRHYYADPFCKVTEAYLSGDFPAFKNALVGLMGYIESR